MKLYNHFEAGTAGSRITAFGSSNPYAWDFVNSSTTVGLYDNTHCRGKMAGLFATDTVTTKAFVSWTPSGGQYGTQTEVYARWYMWVSAAPASSVAIQTFVDGTNSQACRVLYLTSGKLRITNGSGATVADSASALPTGQFVRVELHVVHDTSAGSFELRWYSTDPEAAAGSYDVSVSGSSLNTQANSQGFHLGWHDAISNSPSMWLDAVQVNTSGWIGPSLAEPAASLVAWRNPVLGTVDQSDASGTAVDDYQTRIYVVGYNPEFVATPYRRNNISLQMSVAQGLPEQTDTGTVAYNGASERSTLNAHSVQYHDGDDFWLGVSVLIPKDWPVGVSGDWCLLYQLFGDNGGQSVGSPPFALEIATTDWFSLTVRGGSKASAGDTAPNESFTPIAPIQKGRWSDFMFFIQMRNSSSGNIDCYYKLAEDDWSDTPTVSHAGINMLTVGGVLQTPWHSMNIYRHTRAEVATAYFGLAVAQPERELIEPYFTSDFVNLLKSLLPFDIDPAAPQFALATAAGALAGSQALTGFGSAASLRSLASTPRLPNFTTNPELN